MKPISEEEAAMHASVDGMESVAWRRSMACSSLPFSTDWQHGGPIIESEIAELEWDRYVGDWRAIHRSHAPERPSSAHGSTALIAAMRAFVVSKLGPEIELP